MNLDNAYLDNGLLFFTYPHNASVIYCFQFHWFIHNYVKIAICSNEKKTYILHYRLLLTFLLQDIYVRL